MSTFKPIDFKSSWKKEEQRQEIRQARNVVLEQAKARYEREERKKEEAKLRGEDTWMLPAISNRIDQEAEKVKPKKRKKEKKKKKKKSKKLKKKHKEGSSSSDESDSDEGKWVVKDTAASNAAPAIKGPRLERDDWMTAPIDPLSSLPCVSRDELRAKRKEEKEKEAVKESVIEQLGKHARELNPYWKDGGTGLPEEAPTESKKAAAAAAAKGVAGDGGLAWWQKAYQRCVEQAKEEGSSLEDVASERYGSLEMLEGMLAKAKKAQKHKEEEEMWKATSRQKDTGRDRNRDRDRHRSRSRDRHRSRSRDRHRSRSRERRKRSRSRERQRTRDRSRSRDRYRSRSRERYKSSRPKSRSRSRDRRSRSRGRSRSRERYSSSRQRSRSRDRKDLRLSQLKSRKFKKPGDSSDSDTDKKPYSSSRDAKRKDSVPAWKRKGFVKPRDEDDGEESKPTKRSSSPDLDANRDRKRRHQIMEKAGTSSSSPSAPRWKKADVKLTRGAASKGKASASSSDSTSSQSASESDSESEEEPQPPPKKPARVLTQEEMNKLGSKLVRAEILGNQAEVDRLKAELSEARKAEAEAATAPGSGPAAAGRDNPRNRDAEEEDDKVVVLTRTNKHGMVRPLPTSEHHPEPHRGRRKKKAVTTHTGKERERYFDDDDQHDLKTLVERERMGTAEDQHAMFSRLAGKSFDKTDEEWQVDDVFVSRAARKQATGREEERQKMMAVNEHRKMASALEKCPFCLDNVPKHLIVAMGIKVYVCLPNHRSLTEGHCLIVPMQHVTQGTLVDEDVWDEIQVFRKGLTRMFEDREEDCVFMETSMHLKRQPHMVVECVPMPREVGDLAPIYFKKAIQDSETEWAQNKKLVDLKGRDVRKAVPKGFPYFSVDFGTQSGFAHVIEDEIKFPRYFGKEIVGGMLDVEPQLWRKPAKENFEHQRTKVLQFAEWWKDYDWTQDINKDSD